MLARQKGTRSHKLFGRLWVGLMLAVAISSFWILDIRKGAGFSVIHLLSAWTLVSLALAIYSVAANGQLWTAGPPARFCSTFVLH